MSDPELPAHATLLAMLLAPGWFDGDDQAQVARRLRPLTGRELALLARSGHPKVRVQLDPSGLDHAIRTIRDRLQREDRVDYFIVPGATTAMLRRLFRMPIAEIKTRRAQLLGAHRQRRPRLPKPEERDAVHRYWWDLRKERRQPPTVDDYLQLHRRFPWHTFATLEAIVNEFDD